VNYDDGLSHIQGSRAHRCFPVNTKERGERRAALANQAAEAALQRAASVAGLFSYQRTARIRCSCVYMWRLSIAASLVLWIRCWSIPMITV
jgi:hypothetical protein